MKLTTLCAVSALLASSAALAGGMGHVPTTPIGGDPYGPGAGIGGVGPGGMIGQHPRDLIRPNARSRTTNIYPTLRGTQIRDYSRPGVRIEEDAYGTSVYPTAPYGNVRDYRQPGWRIEQDR
ncbi:hypothetical protein NMQ14_16815 [Methyloversatilis sp. XJ19-13]|uniref:hypothetical protein n=1 Tax=Methyloversatilis sp. XJ19-13 TaxID=2963430 RepID=UPI00211BE49B|nr:hypothetical protein [Methyloversatilis sp. XJ19-13]MCQ9375913.1 hypothetical protein [Methyloversatilis sp. XJ19-13]